MDLASGFCDLFAYANFFTNRRLLTLPLRHLVMHSDDIATINYHVLSTTRKVFLMLSVVKELRDSWPVTI